MNHPSKLLKFAMVSLCGAGLWATYNIVVAQTTSVVTTSSTATSTPVNSIKNLTSSC